ncbi:MAG TPA: DUF952 domain-containing protein [Anaerolineaceae bacterium]
MGKIYHITTARAWAEAEANPPYCGDTLAAEGFIHCSTREQVLKTAERYFPGRSGLVLLEINPDRVECPIRYEGLPGRDQFPHIYGPLNLEAVEVAFAFAACPDGKFEFPVH